jgi:hypothetical protein
MKPLKIPPYPLAVGKGVLSIRFGKKTESFKMMMVFVFQQKGLRLQAFCNGYVVSTVTPR